MQRVEPRAQIDVVAAEPALADDRGDLRGYKRRAFPRGVDHHAGKPRRQRQPPQMSALIGDAAVGVDGAERGEQRFRLGQRRPRRRIEEGELFRTAAPGRQIEREGGKIGGEDFRPGIGLERRGLRLVPQPVADARLGAPGAAAALIRRRARHPHRFKPRDADIGLVARHPRQARSRRRCARPRW